MSATIPPDAQREIWEYLAATAFDRVSVSEFESWVYSEPNLERLIGASDYLALVSFDYRQAHAQVALELLIDGIYASHRAGTIRRDMAAWTVRAFLSERIDLARACAILARLWSNGEEWVPTEFVYIDSELDEVPHSSRYPLWAADALEARLAEWRPRLEEFGRAARVVAKELLMKLDAGEIDVGTGGAHE